MHHPLIPAGGNALRTAALISTHSVVFPRAADDCIPPRIRKPFGPSPTSPAALLLSWAMGLLVCAERSGEEMAARGRSGTIAFETAAPGEHVTRPPRVRERSGTGWRDRDARGNHHLTGVDCVACDARPILGGKVVIQAKR